LADDQLVDQGSMEEFLLVGEIIRGGSVFPMKPRRLFSLPFVENFLQDVIHVALGFSGTVPRSYCVLRRVKLRLDGADPLLVTETRAIFFIKCLKLTFAAPSSVLRRQLTGE
jgi:hypothetical protein